MGADTVNDLRNDIVRESPSERAFRREMAEDVLTGHPNSPTAEYHRSVLAILSELDANDGGTPDRTLPTGDQANHRRQGGAKGGNQYGAYTVRHASPKQTRFLASLLESRDYSGKSERVRAEIDKAARELGTGKVALALSRDVIDALLTCPVIEGTEQHVYRISDKQANLIRRVADEKLGGPEAVDRAMSTDHVDTVEMITSATGRKLIDGLFAMPRKPHEQAPATALDDGMYLTTDNRIFKVQHAVHGSGRQYAKELVDGSFEYARGAIQQLRSEHRMTLAQAKEFGALYGTCIVCGRTLTDEQSIAAGIGPVCASKTAWA